MRAGLVGIVVLVLLAGCQADIPGESRPALSVTPAPYVPVPGVSVGGIDDIDQLAHAHEQALVDRSYTVHMNLTVHRPDGSVHGGTTTRIQVGADHQRFWLVLESFGEYPFDGTAQPNVEAWSNGTTTFLRRTHPDRIVYRAYDTADTGWDQAPPDGATIRAYLGGWKEATVTELDQSDEARFRVTATEGSRSIEATIRDSGLVGEFTAGRPAASFVRLDVAGRATYSVRYEAVGETAVKRPAWLDEAIRVTRNQTYVGQG